MHVLIHTHTLARKGTPEVQLREFGMVLLHRGLTLTAFDNFP